MNGRGRGTAQGEKVKKPPTCFRCGVVGHTSAMCTSETVLKHTSFSVPSLPAHTVPFIDTHCHVDYMVEQARVGSWTEFVAKHKLPKTFGGCITTYCDSTAILSSFSQFEDLTANHPNVHHTFGLHPHNAKYYDERLEARICERVSDPRCVGWGEIGIDLTSNKKGGSDEGEQVMALMRQLELANSLIPDKPIIVHYRGDADAIESLFGGIDPNRKLHFHCWGDPNPDTAKRLLKAFPNLCFGFTGHIVGNFKMRALVASIPLDRFLLESDGPYMLPSSLRPPKGSKIPQPVNHPGNIPFVADTIAKAKGIPIDEVLRAALANTKRMYGVEPLLPTASSSSPERPQPTSPVEKNARGTDGSSTSVDERKDPGPS